MGDRCSLRKSKRVDQGGKGSRLIPTARIVKKIAGERWAPVPQDLNQATICDHRRKRLFHRCSDAYAAQHCLDNQIRIVEGRRPLRD